MELAGTGLFCARWTNRIHDEWIESLLENESKRERAKLERTRGLMNAAVLDCLIADYEPLIPCLTLPDPDDRHVLAAAIRGRADAIVTFNLEDFPPEYLGGLRDRGPTPRRIPVRPHRPRSRDHVRRRQGTPGEIEEPAQVSRGLLGVAREAVVASDGRAPQQSSGLDSMNADAPTGSDGFQDERLAAIVRGKRKTEPVAARCASKARRIVVCQYDRNALYDMNGLHDLERQNDQEGVAPRVD